MFVPLQQQPRYGQGPATLLLVPTAQQQHGTVRQRVRTDIRREHIDWQASEGKLVASVATSATVATSDTLMMLTDRSFSFGLYFGEISLGLITPFHFLSKLLFS